MIFWFLIIAAIPASVLLLRARQLDHLVFFSAGYLFYWVLPVVVGEFPGIDSTSDEAFKVWVGMFKGLAPHKLYTYVASILIYYICFWMGDFLARGVRKSGWIQLNVSLRFIPMLYISVFIATVLVIYQVRWAIGSDYAAVQEVATVRGTLAAMSLTLLGLALMMALELRAQSLKVMLFNRWMMGYFLVAFVLFAMGQRLYFMTSVFLILSYRSLFIKKFTATQLTVGVVVVASMAGAMGLLRLRANFSGGALLQNLAFEPVFTSFSLVSFLQANHIPLLEFPRFLAGDFLNLVPTAILPSKPDLLPDPIKAGFWFTSPLGALNSWVSFVINFGLIGTGVVMAVFGYGLRWLLQRSESPLVRTQYLMCSAFMVFTFFRDPFSVSLVKNIFEFSLMAPLLCALSSTWIAWSVGASFEKGRTPTCSSAPQ